MSKSVSYAMKLFSLFVAYVAASVFGLAVQHKTGMATQLWPASGIALTVVIFWGRSMWPAIFLGTLASHLIHGDPVLPFIGPAVGNILEPFLGAWFCSSRFKFHRSLRNSKDIVLLVFGASMLSTLLGAAIGVPWILISEYHKVDLLYFIRYWAADSVGVLVMTPLLLVHFSPNVFRRFSFKGLSGIESWLLIAIVPVTAVFAFLVDSNVPFYIYFPITMLAALRLGQCGVTTMNLLLSIMAIWLTLTGHSPLGGNVGAQREFYLLFFIATLQLSGLVVASVAMGREDEKVRLLQSNFALAEAIRSRDEFLSIASHELRTPLTPIKLQVQFIQKLIATNRPEDLPVGMLRKSIDTTVHSLNRLNRLIEELLTVSRIRTGRMQINLEKIELVSLLKRIIEQYQLEFDNSKMVVNLKLPDTASGFWDPIKLEEIVVNLITNAIKFGKGFPLEISLTEENEEVTLVVRDHGIGIAPSDQDRIFERFERAASSRHISGMGLGLFIVKQYVNVMGGHIQVESEPGNGAAFTVKLPIRVKCTGTHPDVLAVKDEPIVPFDQVS